MTSQAPYFFNNTPRFSDEDHLSGEKKARILLDWEQFIHSGFAARAFTGDLYRFLIHHCGFIAHTNRQTFWSLYFDHSLPSFKTFLHRFSGQEQLNEIGQDLKLAMVDQLALVYDPINTLLHDLAQNHYQMVAMWLDFARRNQIVTLPPDEDYHLTANTRHLLAFCISIVLKQTQPLALQQMMPLFIPDLQMNQADTNQVHLFQEAVA